MCCHHVFSVEVWDNKMDQYHFSNHIHISSKNESLARLYKVFKTMKIILQMMIIVYFWLEMLMIQPVLFSISNYEKQWQTKFLNLYK